MNENDDMYDGLKPYCTVCGSDLKPLFTEKKQIRWPNRDAGVCQECVTTLRKRFNKNMNMVNPRFRRNE
jgi:hypothetical protein